MKKFFIITFSMFAFFFITSCDVGVNSADQEKEEDFIRFTVNGTCSNTGACLCACDCKSLMDQRANGECTGDGPYGPGDGSGNCSQEGEQCQCQCRCKNQYHNGSN